MNTPEPNLNVLPKCKHLRCKEMYYQPRGQEEDEYSGGAYWCTKTYEVFGPDGEGAGRMECQPGRGCFQNTKASG
jgi:hypothetical protein